MKSKKELKKELDKLVDNIGKKTVLNELNEEVMPYVIKARKGNAAKEDDLTPAQLKELDEAIAEADRGETISFEEFKEAMDKWRTGLKSINGSK